METCVVGWEFMVGGDKIYEGLRNQRRQKEEEWMETTKAQHSALH